MCIKDHGWQPRTVKFLATVTLLRKEDHAVLQKINTVQQKPELTLGSSNTNYQIPWKVARKLFAATLSEYLRIYIYSICLYTDSKCMQG